MTQPQEIDFELPDDARAAIEALADDKERGWRGVADIVVSIIADVESAGQRVNKTKLYADAADLYRCTPATVTQYANVYERVSGLIDDYQDYGFDQWRLMLALAKKNARDLVAEVKAWEATRVTYHGKPVPVRVLRAALAGDGKPQPPDPYRAGLESAVRGLARSEKHAPDAATAGTLGRMRAALAGLLDPQVPAAGWDAEPEPEPGPHGVADWRRAA